MKHFLITYWLEENPRRLGTFGRWAGGHTQLVKAESMRKALDRAFPADCDCYKMEIVPVHSIETEDANEECD